jgi:hypothetical protein
MRPVKTSRAVKHNTWVGGFAHSNHKTHASVNAAKYPKGRGFGGGRKLRALGGGR